MIMTKNKIVLGLSGGVDSTAAALLLKEAGYDVVGLFLDTLGGQQELREEAERIASQLNIEFRYRDLSRQFDDTVISYFCESYMEGRTPNPCVLCNPTIKFRVLEEVADQVGAELIATGHYANVSYASDHKTYYVTKAHNLSKDQSYMLYRLSQKTLARVRFPLGSIESKDQVREIVKSHGISNSEKKDSQEICFIKEGNYIDYLTKRGVEQKTGAFVNLSGEVIGTHKGLIHYTVGQRKGLGITFGKPVFVKRIIPEENRVVLADDEDLYEKEIRCTSPYFSVSSGSQEIFPNLYQGKTLQVKIRYAAKPANATIEQQKDGNLLVLFELPQRAPAPGQSAVFYDGDRVIGGAILANPT